MRAIAILLLLFLVSAAAQAQQDAKPTLSMTVTGHIEIAPDGSLHTYQLDKDKGLPPAVQQLVEQNLRGWTFEPITVDGRPVIARTRLRLMLSAEEVTGGYQLKVENVWFGEPTRSSKMRPPQYPMQAAYAGLGARVILVLKLDASGKVIDVHSEQTSLGAITKNEKQAEEWRAVFEKVSVAAARRWKFDVTEIIEGAPVETSSVRVPVDFEMMGSTSKNRWRGYVPGPRRPAPWVADEVAATHAIDNLGANDTQPLDSRFKLKTQVVGVLL
ncbi:hypothetical protein [Pseudoxanthomonas sp. UTMC 1351]|uniref:hypothetical protein n=1 Tax=Pseudoxanthomonas sp. UTMC 1351 TaxID=2695853 RepID=UPI0034CD1F26